MKISILAIYFLIHLLLLLPLLHLSSSPSSITQKLYVGFKY